jgi:hypothetical protein
MKGLDKLDLSDDDIILIHDTDEIPDIDNILTLDIELVKKGMRSAFDNYYYNLNNKIEEHNPCGIICSYKVLKNNSPQNLRSNWNTFNNSYRGWHFSFFGDEYFISNKIKNFAHQEYNDDYYTDVERIKDVVENNKDIFDRGKENSIMKRIELSDYLPKNYKMLLK